jgi:N-glycosylase/DNA lyase
MGTLSIVRESEFLPSVSLDLEQTLFSGQSFRWIKSSDSDRCFTGIIGTNVLTLKEFEPGVIIVSSTSEIINELRINDFFNRLFTLDINAINVFSESFKMQFSEVWKLANPFTGVRVMKQDPFEIMVTFMCAQGIGMHLIRRQISMIAERYGEKLVLETENGKMVFYSFPAPLALASANRDELALCTNNNRIRAANIIAMARSFDSGKLALVCASSVNCPLETVREALCAHSGIGLKIADCIALFGLGRFDAFPIDTHVKQYLWEWFGIEASRKSLTEKNYRFLQEEAGKILGNEYAGYAGHILFHCWRKEVKKMKAF